MLTKEIRIENFDSLKISLKEKVTILEEIEVKKTKQPNSIKSRFGEIKPEKIGYTSYLFSGKEIRSYSSIGIAEALVGKVPNYTLTDKGVSLRNNKYYALWEIDGMLFEGLPPFLAPEIIESVLVVPSVAGTALYGKRAVGGVIIVNTNRFSYQRNNKVQLKELNHLSVDNLELPTDNDKLSEAVEKAGNDLNKLRLMAFAYQKRSNLKLSLRLRRLILARDPDNIKSYRDVAESLIENNQKKEAWNTYIACLERFGKNIDKTSLEIIFNDMERLYHSYDMKKVVGKAFVPKIKFPNNSVNEMRIVFEWTVPNEILHAEVINPKNQTISFQLGSNSIKSGSVQDFFIDESFKGNWKLNLSVLEETKLKGILKVTMYRNWISSKRIPPKSKLFSFSRAEKAKYKLLTIKL